MGEKNIWVLYHADCMDGYGTAWAAWKSFGVFSASNTFHLSALFVSNKKLYAASLYKLIILQLESFFAKTGKTYMLINSSLV